MSEFETRLLAALGAVDDIFDAEVMVRRAYFYDFEDAPTRLWDGVGIMASTEDVGAALPLSNGEQIAANEWVGTISANGANLHKRPRIGDPRDGTSPRYEFSIPYLDEETFSALEDDQSKVSGRTLTIYRTIFIRGEGLRPTTPIAFAASLEMMGARFEKKLTEQDGTIFRHFDATVLCRSIEYGRSRFPGGTWTDTSQQARAALLGLSSDSGCAFVAGNLNRTYKID